MTERSELRPDDGSEGIVVLRAIASLVLVGGVWGGLLFGAAGTVSWTRGWIHLALFVITFIVNVIVLLRFNRATLLARMRPRPTEEAVEKTLVPFIFTALVALPVIAGLDAVRYEWTQLPIWVAYPGIVLHAFGDAMLLWAMLVNPYLEGAIRVQTERGHKVIRRGPYAIIRHPFYVGMFLVFCGGPLVLGSAWSFVPVIALGIGLVVRTAFEDHMLKRQLPGYEEYAQKTRYRLVPGIW